MKVVVTSSEYLYSEQRALIEDAFQCEVFDNYSSREFALAAECEAHEGYHVQDPVVVLECVDEGGKHVPSGTTGDVLVTDLHNWVFPFIRYEIGDQAVPWYDAPRCTCGRTLSRIQAVAGRQGDQLVLPDGRRLPHQFFPHLFKDVTGIREYQLVQESLELIRLRLEKAPNCAQADIDYVTRHIQQYVGPVVKVETEFVDSVRVGSSNKLRRVISYVK